MARHIKAEEEHPNSSVVKRPEITFFGHEMEFLGQSS